MAERHEPLCKVKGCPHPTDDEWHRCFVDSCRKPAIEHHHFPSRALAGKGAKIAAVVCSLHHKLIGEHHLMEGVYDHKDGTKHYYIKDLQGRDLCDRVIGRWREDEQAPADEAELPEPQETALAPRESRLPVQYLPTGLVLPENLAFEKWQELVGTLKGMIGGVPWWAGDLVNFGERKYGERYAQAMNDLGLKYERLANYAWVAGKVELSTRVENLSWSHHREVADLEPDEQRAWLQRAQDEELTANALRKAISGEEPERCTKSATGRHHFICEHCGKERG